MENQSESFEKKIERKIENRIAKMIGIGVMIFVASAVFILVGGFVVQALWNWPVPGIFGLPTLDFWQALGLLALTRILFGSFGMGSGRGPGRQGGHGRHKGWRGEPPHLSPEEREQIKQSAAGEGA